MTNQARERFIAERARVLATIVLTRRGDLEVRETRKDTGLDLHVTIGREDKAMRLVFGALVRGSTAPTTAAGANKALGPTMGQFVDLRKSTYPVCLFYFTMGDDRGYFSWLAEPVLDRGAPKLVHHQKAHCVELTDEVLDEAVVRVVAWYDAVEAVLIA